MKRLLAACLVASIACLAGPIPAWAHHGYAAYDETTIVSLKGTVTDYELANPHSTMSFDVKDDHGKAFGFYFGRIGAKKISFHVGYK